MVVDLIVIVSNENLVLRGRCQLRAMPIADDANCGRCQLRAMPIAGDANCGRAHRPAPTYAVQKKLNDWELMFVVGGFAANTHQFFYNGILTVGADLCVRPNNVRPNNVRPNHIKYF